MQRLFRICPWGLAALIYLDKSLDLGFFPQSASTQLKETAEERKVRLRKLAMWNAAQKKGMTEVVGRAETTVDIKVGLMKPLGSFNLTKRKFCDVILSVPSYGAPSNHKVLIVRG